MENQKAKGKNQKLKTSVKTAGVQTMEELLASTGYKFKGFKRGETVTGNVMEVTGRTVFVDIGGKADAIVAEQEFELSKDYFRGLKPGDEITGVVLITENDSGQVILSLRRAVADTKWKKFEEALENDEVVTVKAREVTKGGLLVESDGMYGFIPASQLSREWDGNVAGLVGRNIQVKVIEVDKAQNRLVLSEKAVSEAEEIEKRRKVLEKVKIGGNYEGVVVGMVPFGAFVEVKVNGKSTKKKEEAGEKLEGLVHISEISWEKVDDVSKILKEGDKVTVQVIGVDESNGKLALSLKRLLSDPWQIVTAKYAVDSRHVGTVTKVVPYGVLVKMEKGIEGLIHASKMPADMSFAEGQEVNVFVESVDLDKRRLSLGVVLTEKPVGYK